MYQKRACNVLLLLPYPSRKVRYIDHSKIRKITIEFATKNITSLLFDCFLFNAIHIFATAKINNKAMHITSMYLIISPNFNKVSHLYLSAQRS